MFPKLSILHEIHNPIYKYTRFIYEFLYKLFEPFFENNQNLHYVEHQEVKYISGMYIYMHTIYVFRMFHQLTFQQQLSDIMLQQILLIRLLVLIYD